MALALLCLGLLVAALAHHGHAAESVDQRQYIQMINGIRNHGLPYWDNGPYDRFPQLMFPWGNPWKGVIWGQYGILYPYLVAPLLALDDLLLVSRVTFAMLIPLALVTFLLAKRVLRSEWYATGAAALAVLSTPVLAKSLEMTAYPLMTLLATLAVYLTLRLVESNARWPMGVACGVTWAAASAAHAVCFPMALGGLLVLGIAPDPATGERTPRDTIARFAPALAGFIAATLPVCYVNHLRFDSWNPVSYGPPPWAGPQGMTLVDQMQYSRPAAAFAIVVAALLFVTRKRRWWPGILVGAIVVAGALEPLRERFVRYFVVTMANLVGVLFVGLPKPYEAAPDGLGYLLGGWVAKGMLQSTPILLLAPLAFWGADRKRRWDLMALMVPAATLMAALTARANIEYIEALGWPWVYGRYTLPMLPALVVVSLVVVERMDLGVGEAVAAAVLGLLVAILLLDASDTPLSERVVVLVIPLLAAAAAFVAAVHVLRSPSPSRLAPMIVSLTIGVGIGIACGHDLRANQSAKHLADRNFDRFVKIVPKRFALLGPQKDAYDSFLTTVTTHDVKYAEIRRFPLPEHRPLIDYWRAEGRPIYIYYLPDQEPRSPWQDIAFVKDESMPEILRLEFRGHQ